MDGTRDIAHRPSLFTRVCISSLIKSYPDWSDFQIVERVIEIFDLPVSKFWSLRKVSDQSCRVECVDKAFGYSVPSHGDLSCLFCDQVSRSRIPATTSVVAHSTLNIESRSADEILRSVEWNTRNYCHANFDLPCYDGSLVTHDYQVNGTSKSD